MNRILKRPMFRIGGSAGTGITSGLNQPQQMAKGGRINYQQGTTPNFQFAGMPGFLTSFGLNLLATPPQGNIFSTAATAARDPFNRLQAQQTAALKTKADRDFARALAAEEREFEAGQLTRKLQSAEKIAGMDTTDETKRVQEIADEKYDSDIIKAQREVDFPTKVYPGLKEQYGDKQVATAVIDTSILSTPKKIDKFVDQNPFLASKVVYDVATDTAMRVVKDRLTGQFVLIPADSADIDTTGDDMPAPNRTPGLFGQKTKPNIIGPAIERLGEEFSDDFYQGG